MSSPVVLQRGQPHQKTALENLIQLYVSDFSEYWSEAHRVDIGEDGRFPPFPHLGEYWSDPTRAVWFIRVGGALAGFALLNRHANSGLPLDHNFGEFFVARPYRRAGVGASAAAQLIGAHRGRWEAAIAQRNLPAQRFWPRAIEAANTAQVETLTGDGVSWNGPIIRFLAL